MFFLAYLHNTSLMEVFVSVHSPFLVRWKYQTFKHPLGLQICSTPLQDLYTVTSSDELIHRCQGLQSRTGQSHPGDKVSMLSL